MKRIPPPQGRQLARPRRLRCRKYTHAWAALPIAPSGKITSKTEFSTWQQDSCGMFTKRYPPTPPFWGPQRRHKMTPGFGKGHLLCPVILTVQSLMNGVGIRSLLGRRSPETGSASREQTCSSCAKNEIGELLYSTFASDPCASWDPPPLVSWL